MSRAPCYCNWASNHRTAKFKALCLKKVAFPQKYYFRWSTKYPKHIHDTSFFFIKKEASCLQNKNRFYSIFSCFLGHVMFWTSARCWQFRQDRFRLSCTHSAVSSWNAKRWSSLFLEKLNYRKHIYFTVLFSPDKKLLSKPLQQYYFYYIRIQFDTWDW